MKIITAKKETELAKKILKLQKIINRYDIKDFLNGTELLAEISVEIMSQKAFENMINRSNEE